MWCRTANESFKRCILMATDPGDLVFDPTCGSGTTAYVAEQWGRRWITCDTSRVAITLAKQRLMTALFDYYELAHPEEGVGSGFHYSTVSHITLRDIANNTVIDDIWEKHQEELEPLRARLNAAAGESWDEWEIPREATDEWPEETVQLHQEWWEHRIARQQEIDAAIARHAPQETLYDQPLVDTGKRRVTGPFSVEAVPAPAVRPIDDSDEWVVDSDEDSPLSTTHNPLATTLGRSGETLRQSEWRDELLKTGIRGKGGQFILFARLEALPGCRYLHADGESRPNEEGADRIREDGPARQSQRIVVSFGPEHAPLEQRQVEWAIQEAQTLVPRPRVVVFAAFQFDPEASKDIDETNWPGLTLLKAQMNADLLTEDLKRKRASNESFWLIGQPDVVVDSEEWIVDSAKEALAPYDVVAKLSGLDSLAEINGLGRERLSAIIAIAERGDLWDALAAYAGGSVGSGQYSGGTGAPRTGGVSALSRSRSGLPGRIGDAAHFVRQLESLGRGRIDEGIESLRRDRQVADRAGAIAAALTPPLSTIHYAQVAVQGFDYYNTKTGDVESGGEDQIAVWSLDTDYDGRSLYPRQVFFPMSGPNDGWSRLARNLKAEIDEDLIEAYRGAVSLPFEAGEHRRIAVKIVDDRGIESLKVVGLDGEPTASREPLSKLPSIEEEIAEIWKDVPQEELDKIPTDLSHRHDYYNSGADDTERPKRAVEDILEEYSQKVPSEKWADLPPDLIERLDYYTSGADV